MNLPANSIAWSQVVNFTLTLLGFMGLMFVIVLGIAHLNNESEKLAYTMLGVLGTILTQQSGYFYARQRSEGQPHPTQPPPAAKS
jgi:hypothetical protein